MAEDLGVFDGLDHALDRLLRARPESAAELADAIGVTRSSLSRYRRGRGLPSVGVLGRLLSRCGVPLSQLEDLLIDARGEQVASDPDAPTPDAGLPEYLPLGLLVLPLSETGQGARPQNAQDVRQYLVRMLMHYQVSLPHTSKDKDSADG